jgi:hypothetical protein
MDFLSEETVFVQAFDIFQKRSINLNDNLQRHKVDKRKMQQGRSLGFCHGL